MSSIYPFLSEYKSPKFSVKNVPYHLSESDISRHFRVEFYGCLTYNISFANKEKTVTHEDISRAVFKILGQIENAIYPRSASLWQLG